MTTHQGRFAWTIVELAEKRLEDEDRCQQSSEDEAESDNDRDASQDLGFPGDKGRVAADRVAGIERVDGGDGRGGPSIGPGKRSEVLRSQSADLGDPERSELHGKFALLDPPSLGNSDSPDPDHGSVRPAPGPAVSSFRQASGISPRFESDESCDLAVYPCTHNVNETRLS